MNKNNIIIGIFTGIAVAGVAYCIKKMKDCQNNIDETNREIGRQFQNIYDKFKEESKENVEETSAVKDDDFLERMMAEEAEAEKATKNWAEREAACKKEMSEKASIKDQNMFTDSVTNSKEFEALNKIREASGKEPLKVDEKFEKFLGKDSDKSMKESLDNIAENVKKDPKLKNKILGILQE